MSVVVIYPPDGGEAIQFDLTSVISPRSMGLENAWEVGCEMFQKMLMLLVVLQNHHNRIKADLYQEFKLLPVNKDATMGPINPGTDTYFSGTWLPANGVYQVSRTQRDLVQGTMEALKMTYIPRLRMLFEKTDWGERNVASQAGGTNPPPPQAATVAAPISTPVPSPVMASTR